jgi:GTPase SAR1 family protein
MPPASALEDCTLQLGQYHDRRGKVIGLLNRISAAAERLHVSALMPEITRLTKDLQSEVFNLVAVGEFSRGKSSVINALLGEGVLPMAAKPTTAVLSVISAGAKPSYCLSFHDGSSRTITAEEFASLVAPAKPSRRDEPGLLRYEATLRELRNVALARITYPSPICTAGVEIVDTPGTNDMDPMREQITYEFIPRADAVLFVLSGKSILAQTEIDLLKRIVKADIQRVFFLVNFADLLTDANRQKVYDYASKHLATIVDDPRIYMVSATRELARASGLDTSANVTGFETFKRDLAGFLADERGRIKLSRPLARGLRFCEELVRGPLAVARASIGIQLPELMRRIAAITPQIQQLERERDSCVSQLRIALTNRRLELVQAMRTGLGGIARTAVCAVDEYTGPLNKQQISSHLEQRIAPVQTAFQSQCAERESRALKDETEIVERRMQVAYQSLDKSIQDVFVSPESFLAISPMETSRAQQEQIVLARVGGIGVGIAAIGLHLFFPLAILAGWVGSLLFTGWFENQARLEALGKIRLEIDQRYRENIPATVIGFEKRWALIVERLCESLESDFNRHRDELQTQLSEIVAEHKRSTRSAEERRSEINTLSCELDEIREQLTAEQC